MASEPPPHSVAVEEVYDNSVTLTVSEALLTAKAVRIPNKLASSLLAALGQDNALPLHKYGLSHVKRIRRSSESGFVELLLVPDTAQALADLRQAFSGVPSLAACSDLLDGVFDVKVARYEPNTRKEFEAWGKQVGWPISFHSTEEDRDREKGLPPCDSAAAQTHLNALAIDPSLSGFIVNPANNAVVTTTRDVAAYLLKEKEINVAGHPVYTPTMLLVEGVAAIVRGELKGADILSDDPYLCTGLDIYLQTEPDLMSSMALVHSRIRRVFYVAEDKTAGALGSVCSLHQNRSLNHKFRVFRLVRKV